MQKLHMYTDGACSGNPGPGGWGVIIIDNKEEEKIYGSESYTTNNKMELTAIIEGIMHINSRYNDVAVDIFTDSTYVKNGITIWIKNWIKNNWKTANKKDVKNKDLWVQLHGLVSQLKVQWYWVKAHNGNKYNEIADTLARNAYKSYKDGCS